jgi:prephenate dehydrogenase
LLRGKTIGVVGLGQIGGSIIKSLAPHSADVSLVGFDRDSALRTRLRRHAAWAATLEEIVIDSDLLLLAVPVPAILKLLPIVAALARKRNGSARLLVLDTGTIKAPVVRAAAKYRRDMEFIGLHPLSGGERNGWPASRADLFLGDRVICCAKTRTRAESIAHELIALLGAHVIHIDPARHDRLIATTIGLPHMLAYAAQGLPARSGAVRRLHGRSWGTLTRVAVSDPEMVGGFLCTNSREQTRIARLFQKRLNLMIAALDDPTGRKIETLLRRWRAK